MFPALCHSLVTFDHKYYCILPVTAETQRKPAETIPPLKPPAYKEQDNTGGSTCPKDTVRFYTSGCKVITCSLVKLTNDHFTFAFSTADKNLRYDSLLDEFSNDLMLQSPGQR